MLSLCLFSHSSRLGGAEKSLLDLTKILISKNIRCTIIMEGNGPLYEECKYLGIETKVFSQIAWWCSQDLQKNINKDLYQTIENCLYEMIKYIKEFSPTAIYSQTIVSPIGALIAEYLDLPHFTSIREYGEIDHGLNFNFGFSRSMNMLYSSSDYIFSITKSTAKCVLKNKYKNENVKINYSKINLPILSEKQIINSNSVNIGIIGTIQEGKNQEDIIKATFSLLNKGFNIKLYIIGDSSKNLYHEKLLSLVDNSIYKNNIIFTGHVENSIELMSKFNIIVSCAKKEGLGRTLIEAILLNIPIIYANSGGPKEIFNSNFGLPYKINDINDLVSKIIKTLSDKNETKKRIKNAYSYITKTFTDDTYSSPIIEALEKVKNKKPRRKEKYLVNFFNKNLNIDLLIKLGKYQFTLFFETHNGYSSIKSEVKRHSLTQVIMFDLKSIKFINNLFLEILDTYCIVRINKIICICKNNIIDLTSKFSTNATFVDENHLYYFDSKSPKIFIDNFQKEITCKLDSLEIEIDYLSRGDNALNKIVDILKKENEKSKFLILKKESFKIVFFGASNALEKQWDFFTKNHIKPDYICDNDLKKQGFNFKEHIIQAPNELFNKNELFIVFITSSYIKEIKSQLSKYSNILKIETL